MPYEQLTNVIIVFHSYFKKSQIESILVKYTAVIIILPTLHVNTNNMFILYSFLDGFVKNNIVSVQN